MKKKKPFSIPEETPKQKFIVIGDYMGLGTAFIAMALKQGHDVLFWAFDEFDVTNLKVKDWTISLKKTNSINWFELSDDGVVIVDAQEWSESKENLNLYSAAEVPVIFLDPATDKNSIINPSNHVLVVSPSPVPEIDSLMFDFKSIIGGYLSCSLEKGEINFGLESFYSGSRALENPHLLAVKDFSLQCLTKAGYKLLYGKLLPAVVEEQKILGFECGDYFYDYFSQAYSFLFEDRDQMLSLSDFFSTFMSETYHYGEYEEPVVGPGTWSVIKKDRTLGFSYSFFGNCLAFLFFSNQTNPVDCLFSRYYGLGNFFARCSSPEFKPQVWDMLDLV